MRVETRTVRSVDWERSPRAMMRESCSFKDCMSDYRNCRLTDEGLFCLSCYVNLPSCDRCGRPASQWLGKRDGERVPVCRNCMCCSDESVDRLIDFQFIASPRSCMGIGW